MLPNGLIWAVTTMKTTKINQTHRESVVASVTKDRAWGLGKGSRSKYSQASPISYPQAKAQCCASYASREAIRTGDWGQRKVLPLEET